MQVIELRRAIAMVWVDEPHMLVHPAQHCSEPYTHVELNGMVFLPADLRQSSIRCQMLPLIWCEGTAYSNGSTFTQRGPLTVCNEQPTAGKEGGQSNVISEATTS